MTAAGMVRLHVEVRQQILKGAACGAMMKSNGTGCRTGRGSREISVELRMTATIFSAVLTCAAACGNGSSSTEHCRWCSGDSCRWCSRIHLVELQVVQQRDFSGAADGAAMFSAILIFAAACGTGSSSTEHCKWCSGDSCRWCSRIHLVELQVVW